MDGHHIQQTGHQPDMVAISARGQLNGEDHLSLSPFALENLVSRDRSSRPVLHQPAHYLHLKLKLVLTHGPLSFLPLSATMTASMYTINHHRVSPVFIG